MSNLEKRIRELINRNFDYFIEIRRDLHQHPELSLCEFRTADVVENQLKAWNITVGERINKTSIEAVVKGRDESAKTIALRADMDALPIKELNNIEYKSLFPGVMHACGHDVHTTIQLGAAFVLQELRDELPGDVKLFFQQAEETIGGAKTMIKAGVLDDPHVSNVIGLHVCPKLDVGTFGINYGHAYASSDTITIYVHGHGAHAASPQDGVDAIVLASQIVTSLQTLVSRNTCPFDSAVLSFGMISGGDAHNIICDHVVIRGTLRTLKPSVRKIFKERIFEMSTNIAKAYGGDVSLSIDSGYDALVNNDEVTDLVVDVAKKVFGKENVIILDHPSLGVEDFAYFANERPSSYNRLGVANKAKGITATLHDGQFDVDEEAIRYGILHQVLCVFALMGVDIDG